MNILIITPILNGIGGGGVGNQYKGLWPYWTENVEYCYYGKRRHVRAIFTFIPDIIIFIVKLLTHRYDVVMLNPSLRSYQLFRDGIYIVIARVFKRKTVAFIHGWDNSMAEKIKLHPALFRSIYGRCCLIFVLYSGFKKTLDSLGIHAKVVLSSTKIEDNLLENFDIDSRNDGKIDSILFMSRPDRDKGLDITIEAFRLLKKKYQYLKLNVCGEGKLFKDMAEYVEKQGIPDVYFHGYVDNDNKIKQLTINNLYILPSRSEGMATTVLESMAFGMPVITRPVGGVIDFWKEGELGGFLIKSFNPIDYANSIDFLIRNPEITRKISLNNYAYAKQHFYASQVAKNIEQQLISYCR